MNIVFKGLSKFVDVMINRGALRSPSTGKTGAILNGLILRFCQRDRLEVSGLCRMDLCPASSNGPLCSMSRQ